MKKTPEQIFDELLVIRYREGDSRAFELLMKRWHQKIKRQVTRHTYEQEIAEDLAQEVWEAILKGIYRLREPALFGIWVMRIASAKAVDWIRRNQKERKIADLEWMEEQPAEEDAMEKIQSGLRRLPEDQRMILIMFYLEKNSVQEVSSILNIPVGTVKSRLFNARNELKKLLNK